MSNLKIIATSRRGAHVLAPGQLDQVRDQILIVLADYQTCSVSTCPTCYHSDYSDDGIQLCKTCSTDVYWWSRREGIRLSVADHLIATVKILARRA